MKPGDPVTVVTANGRIQLARVSYVDLHQRQFRWNTDWDYSEVLYLDDEGITWIRRSHPVSTAEAQALMAAWKLRPPRALAPEYASALYRDGKTSFDDWKANLDRWEVEFEGEMRR